MGMERPDYKVRLQWDAETKQVVADIPALGISDYAPDAASAFESLREMAAFHLECLFEEGAPAPVETDGSEGCSSEFAARLVPLKLLPSR